MNKEEYEIMYQLEDTHWWYVGMRNIVFELLSKSRVDGRTDTTSILDAGCGTGGMLEHLCENGSGVDAWGFDASEEALAFCQQRGLSRLVMASVTDIPFAAASFDLVVSFDVLYHKNVKDDVASLKELRRLLKTGGQLLLRLPAYDWLRGSHDAAVHTRQRYTAPEVRHKMAQAGFRVERVTYANTILFPVAAAKRFAEMAFGLRSGSDVKPVSPLANRMLAGVLDIEARLLRKMDFPWGLSVYGLGRAE